MKTRVKGQPGSCFRGLEFSCQLFVFVSFTLRLCARGGEFKKTRLPHALSLLSRFTG